MIRLFSKKALADSAEFLSGADANTNGMITNPYEAFALKITGKT